VKAELSEAAKIIRAAENVLVFTGAGVSAESGIPTFRDEDGFWREFPPEQFATWSGLLKIATLNPQRFVAFVRAVIGPIATARPNAAHIAVAAAEKHRAITVVTQNIDGLHQEAGSTVVHEVHGSLLQIITEPGRHVTSIGRQDLLRIDSLLAGIDKGGFALPKIMRTLGEMFGFDLHGIRHPNIVLFGDQLAEPDWTLARTAARASDCVIQIGCSGVVWPAAEIPDIARRAGASVIVIDPNNADGDIWLKGTATSMTPTLFNMIA
jgi:NAD-dependent deacetylase